MSSGGSRPWSDVELPVEVTRVPAMLQDEERQYLYWVTRHAYEGWGEIVELGPWVGASSAALAAGLRDRGSQARVRSFDLFEWKPRYMERILRARLPERADFLHVFREQTATFERWIDARKTDLLQATWDGPVIEILFVDAAKTWELFDAILRTFGPFLRAGRSRVIHQDFRHYAHPWLPLCTDSQPDLWSQAEAVERGQTVTFVPRRSLDGVAPLRPDDFSIAQVDEIFARRVEQETRTSNKVYFQLGWMCEAIRRGEEARADELARAIAAARGELDIAVDLATAALSAAEQVARTHPGLARNIAVRCLAEQPDHALATRLLGMTSFRLGDTARAQAALTRSLELSPADPAVHLHLAELHRGTGDVAEAARHAELSLCCLRETTAPWLLRWAVQSLRASWTETVERTPDARAALQRVLALVPGDEWASGALAALPAGDASS